MNNYASIPCSNRVTSRFTLGSEIEPEVALLLHSNYLHCAELAGIEPCDLESHILNGNCVVWRQFPREDIGFCGIFIGDVYMVSHICIANQRDRYNYLLDLLYTSTPVVFAVPIHLAKQLQRLGYRMLPNPIPMYFRGEWIDKYVCLNHSVTNEDISMLIQHYMENF